MVWQEIIIRYLTTTIFILFYAYLYLVLNASLRCLSVMFLQFPNASVAFHAIWQVFTIHYAVFVYNFVTSLMNIDLGVYRFYVSFMDKVFKFISRHETIFLDLEASREPNNTNIDTNNCSNDLEHIRKISAPDEAKCFIEEEPEHWNMLQPYGVRDGQRIPLTLVGKIVWALGAIVRYTFFVPLRFQLLLFDIVYLTANLTIIPYILPERIKSLFFRANYPRMCPLSVCVSGGYLRCHDTSYLPEDCQVVVSNHTTPLDGLFSDSVRTFCYFARSREGFFNFIFKITAANRIFFLFNPDEKDKLSEKTESYLKDSRHAPIIIYPEGTCTPANVIMRFRKGWFDIVSKVYPFATRYDTRYGPIFWNSKTTSFLAYMWQLSCNWAAVCDIYFMPPVGKQADESGIEFAKRVQSKIADRIDLKIVNCDGYSMKYGPKR